MSFSLHQPSDISRELYDAARLGDVEVVTKLLKDGADPCWRRSWPSAGDTALHAAAGAGHRNVVEVLLHHGAAPAQGDDRGCTPLHRAAEAGNEEIVGSLLSRPGVDVNVCDWDGTTPLHRACFEGHEPVVRRLLQQGADPERRSVNYSLPIIQAAANNHVECIQVLLEFGASVNVCENDLSQATHAAANFGCSDALSLLLEHGAAADRPDAEDRSPLFLAAENEHHECISILIAAGADCIPAATCAATNRQWRITELLLQHTDKAPGHEVMLLAIADVRLSIVAVLLQRGVLSAEADIVSSLVPPVSRGGELAHSDAVEEEWLSHVYTDSRLGDLVALLELLYETGLISSRTLTQQRDFLAVPRCLEPLSLRCVCAAVIRRQVCNVGGEVYEELGLPHAMAEFVACHHLRERFAPIPPIRWDGSSDDDERT